MFTIWQTATERQGAAGSRYRPLVRADSVLVNQPLQCLVADRADIKQTQRAQRRQGINDIFLDVHPRDRRSTCITPNAGTLLSLMQN